MLFYFSPKSIEGEKIKKERVADECDWQIRDLSSEGCSGLRGPPVTSHCADKLGWTKAQSIWALAPLWWQRAT